MKIQKLPPDIVKNLLKNKFSEKLISLETFFLPKQDTKGLWPF